MSEDIIKYKILVLGDSNVGKSAFILRFCEDKFEDDSLSTIGLDTKTKFISHQNLKIQLQIWDTAGQERFRSIAKSCYKGAHGILLVYDVTNLETFKHIKSWINDIQSKINKPMDEIALYVIGNKCDLPEERKKVNKEDITKLKEEFNLDVMEVSAKIDKNVNESMVALIDKMIKLGIGMKNNDEDEEEGQKLEKNKTKKKKDCCGGKDKDKKNKKK